MNIIKDQRETIINENNTAQQQLKDVLDNMNRTLKTLDIREHLRGDIDLSILKEEDFRNIDTIILNDGEITNILNIPEGITKFVCKKNLLFTIENLPSSLVHLEITENYLSTIDLAELNKLTHLNLSHNHLTEIENIPKELVELKCSFNHFTHLDLQGLYKLRVLNISNNKITLIENLPQELVDFVYENNPAIEFRNSPIIPNEKIEEDDIEHQLNYHESLNKYFKLKSAYETKLYEQKKELYKKSEKNIKIARKQISMLKPKCIKCKRAVGTIFTKKDNAYIAMCGDTKDPCKLNIELYAGSFDSVQTKLYEYKVFQEESKDTIIRQKLDTLFNYVDEHKSIKKFKKELEDYTMLSAGMKDLLDKHNENFNNPQKKELIQKKREIIFEYIENIKILLEEYEKTDDRDILKSAVEIQVKDLLPETKNLRLLMSEHMEMTTDVEYSVDIDEYGEEKAGRKLDNVFYLFKHDVALSKLDYTFGEQPRVIHFKL
uniref:Leucine-rich repeat domain-containing protein n=1 Tax=viral metagenome TaxID=1070528 RepID=A0A6C0KK73_9ZZZZ